MMIMVMMMMMMILAWMVGRWLVGACAEPGGGVEQRLDGGVDEVRIADTPLPDHQWLWLP